MLLAFYLIKGATLTVALFFLCPLAWMDEEERECLFVPDEAFGVEPQQASIKPQIVHLWQVVHL